MGDALTAYGFGLDGELSRGLRARPPADTLRWVETELGARVLDTRPLEGGGAATGTPAIVMSALPGSVVWWPADQETWLRRLAEALPAVHAVPLAPDLDEWAPYEPTPNMVPPPWTRHRQAWERALELYEGPRPSSDRVFLHRDFHPGNVLWTGDRIAGIVDWGLVLCGAAGGGRGALPGQHRAASRCRGGGRVPIALDAGRGSAHL